MFMIVVLKYSSFCLLITHDLVDFVCFAAYSACCTSVEGSITNYDCYRNRRNSETLGKIAGLQRVQQKLSKQQGDEGS